MALKQTIYSSTISTWTSVKTKFENGEAGVNAKGKWCCLSPIILLLNLTKINWPKVVQHRLVVSEDLKSVNNEMGNYIQSMGWY